MKIYYGELTPEQMQQNGATYQECANCGKAPLIWQQTVFDAVCESCGAWQKDVLPDGLTGREIEKWYLDKEKEKMNGYCLHGEHDNCPDTLQDNYLCACSCHIEKEKGK